MYSFFTRVQQASSLGVGEEEGAFQGRQVVEAGEEVHHLLRGEEVVEVARLSILAVVAGEVAVAPVPAARWSYRWLVWSAAWRWLYLSRLPRLEPVHYSPQD